VIVRLFGLVALAFGILNFAWALICVRRGYFYAYLSAISRTADPFLFWLSVGSSIALGPLMAAGGTILYFGLWP